MVKIIGACLFIIMTSWIGYDWSRQLEKRSKQLRQMIHSLQMLETEMAYTNATLPVIFTALQHKTTAPISGFYQYLQTKLYTAIVDFPPIWDEALKYLADHSALKQEELEILSQFGQNLGNHSFLQQEKHIHLTMQHLKHISTTAREEQHKYERMSKTLGVLSGIFIVILLY